MPFLEIRVSTTNGKSADELKAVAKRLSKGVVDLYEKPEAVMGVTLHTDDVMCFGGDTETPSAVSTVQAIGKVDAEHNKKVIEFITHTVQEAFGVAPTRHHIVFFDVSAVNWGCAGRTVAEIHAEQQQ